MVISATQFRSNIYKILDRAIQTGEEINISRHGKIVKVVPPPKLSKLDKVKKVGKIIGDPESIVHMDWSKYWKGLPK